MSGTSFEQSELTAHVLVAGGAVVVVVVLVVDEDVATQEEPDASKPERQPARTSRASASGLWRRERALSEEPRPFEVSKELGRGKERRREGRTVRALAVQAEAVGVGGHLVRAVGRNGARLGRRRRSSSRGRGRGRRLDAGRARRLEARTAACEIGSGQGQLPSPVATHVRARDPRWDSEAARRSRRGRRTHGTSTSRSRSSGSSCPARRSSSPS